MHCDRCPLCAVSLVLAHWPGHVYLLQSVHDLQGERGLSHECSYCKSRSTASEKDSGVGDTLGSGVSSFFFCGNEETGRRVTAAAPNTPIRADAFQAFFFIWFSME